METMHAVEKAATGGIFILTLGPRELYMPNSAATQFEKRIHKKACYVFTDLWQ